MNGWIHAIIIAVGGGLGSAARYGLSTAVTGAMGSHWPFGTLAINVAGSFLMGFAVALGEAHGWSPPVRLALTTGFLGGFTTYSAFNHETLGSLRSGAWGAGFGYLLATVFTCLAAGWAGLQIGSWWTRS